MIKNGIYVGYSEPQNSGNCQDTGKTEMFPYVGSAISKGTKSGNIIGWKMTPEKLFVLFDFTVPTFIEEISVETAELSADERRIWGAALINVSCCDEIGHKYHALGRFYPDNTGVPSKLPINRKVRFIKLEINRSPWRAYSMPKVTFYGDEPTVTGKPLTTEEMKKEFLYEPISVDQYGQAIFADWDGKIHNEEQMKKNAEKETAFYQNIVHDDRYDRYGGIRNFKNLRATGFFRIEKVDGIWWFVTPEGNPYIMKGIDLVCYSEMSYHTPIYIKDTNEVRGIFNELPDKEKYEMAYETSPFGIPVLNYLKMNLYRKYGKDFDAKWVEMTQKRLADWGFNASAKWDKHPDICMPYIYSLGGKAPFKKVKWLIDPYDEKFAENVELSVKDTLPTLKDDPYLIGYHYTNESGFDMEIFRAMLASDENCAMKKAFITYLDEKYSCNQLVEMLNVSVCNTQELLNMDLSKKDFPQNDVNAFITQTAKIYYKTIRDGIKKYDPNHLYMGAGITPNWRSCYEWDVGGLEYLDVLSFDHYTRSTDHWIEKYAAHDFPLINIEFSFTASDRGMSPIFAQIHCKDQEERGKEYKDFMEYSFSLPQFVGSGFFILHDQPLAGRCNGDGSYGECHNFGLVDITDEPYGDMIKYVKEVHKNLEKIHAGE